MFRRHHVSVAAAIGVLLLALALSGAINVSAHAQYASSNPPANSTVQTAPAAVQVTWTEELGSVKFNIAGPDGSEVTTGPAQINLEERHTATVPVRNAGPGRYVVVWHNVSGDDGDPNDGSFTYTVAGTPATAPTTTTTSSAAVPAPTARPGTTSNALACPANEPRTPGIADVRIDTYCKRQLIRDQYKGKIDERVFNYDLSIGMGLESALKDAMEEQFG
jgi:copper resistance protein C